MKKTSYILLVVFILSTTCIHAAERSLEQKKNAAINAISKLQGVTRSITAEIKELKKLDGLSVIGYEDGGFAVIANDDRNEAVIGYSKSIYSDRMPDGFEWWINNANKMLNSSSAYTRSASSPAVDYGAKAYVEPLVETKWGQSSPYNNLCPMSSGKRTLTGCVATAMSQIMKYYKYPESGEGSIYDITQGIFVDFSEKYNWDNMLNVYTLTSDPNANNAVATIMYHCGVSVGMNYGVEFSGAFIYKAATALRTYFKYNENVSYRSREFHTKDYWMRSIYTELSNGWPILYGGQDEDTGGHAFVFDGYDENGFVHVNWGWEGEFDGYYDINLLNPDKYQYSTGQHMLTGFTKPEMNVEHLSEITTSSNIAISEYNGRLILSLTDYTLYNYNDYAFSGDFYLMLDGELVKKPIAVIDEERKIDAPNSSGRLFGFKLNKTVEATLPTDLSDGTYKLYVAVKETGRDYQPVFHSEGTTSYYTLVKEGTNITLTPGSGDVSGIKDEMIGGNKQETTTTVYDSRGMVVYRGSSDSFNINDVTAKGLLIIKAGNTVKKVMK